MSLQDLAHIHDVSHLWTLFRDERICCNLLHMAGILLEQISSTPRGRLVHASYTTATVQMIAFITSK